MASSLLTFTVVNVTYTQIEIQVTDTVMTGGATPGPFQMILRDNITSFRYNNPNLLGSAGVNPANQNYTLTVSDFAGFPPHSGYTSYLYAQSVPYGTENYQVVGFPFAVPCFTQGTRIRTADGYKAVETLTTDDRAYTPDGRFVRIHLFKLSIPRTTQDTAPYLVRAGAFGPLSPPRDLRVSGLHAVQDAAGVWHIPFVSAKKNEMVVQYDVGKPVTYYHVECPDFYTDDLMAEGCVVESFRHKQGGPRVVYEWSDDLGGFIRFKKEEAHRAAKPHAMAVVVR